MDIQEKRKDNRSAAFIQITISAPTSIDKRGVEIVGWIKNVSKDGIGLEICISSSDETIFLMELTKNKQEVLATIALPHDSSFKANCRVVWGKLLYNKTFYIYNMGLRILKIDPLLHYKWDYFVETFLR